VFDKPAQSAARRQHDLLTRVAGGHLRTDLVDQRHRGDGAAIGGVLQDRQDSIGHPHIDLGWSAVALALVQQAAKTPADVAGLLAAQRTRRHLDPGRLQLACLHLAAPSLARLLVARPGRQRRVVRVGHAVDDLIDVRLPPQRPLGLLAGQRLPHRATLGGGGVLRDRRPQRQITGGGDRSQIHPHPLPVAQPVQQRESPCGRSHAVLGVLPLDQVPQVQPQHGPSPAVVTTVSTSSSRSRSVASRQCQSRWRTNGITGA